MTGIQRWPARSITLVAALILSLFVGCDRGPQSRAAGDARPTPDARVAPDQGPVPAPADAASPSPPLAVDAAPDASDPALVRLLPSGPVTATRDGQVIERLVITASPSDPCGVKVAGLSNVEIREVLIEHARVGICAERAPGLRIEAVKLVSLSTPATGPHCQPGVTDCWDDKSKQAIADQRLSIRVYDSADVSIRKVYARGSSTGIYLLESPKAVIDELVCEDMRGPRPRGQCVLFNASDDGRLTNFYAKNEKNVSFSEDNINAYKSDRVHVAHGLIDGNWSINGVGVIADIGSDDMRVEDVDVLNTGVAAVSVWSMDETNIGERFHAEKIRVRDTHCDARQGLEPSSGGLVFANHPASLEPVFKDITYFNHCRSQVGYCLPGAACRDNDTGALINLKQAAFTPRKPLVIDFAWE